MKFILQGPMCSGKTTLTLMMTEGKDCISVRDEPSLRVAEINDLTAVMDNIRLTPKLISLMESATCSIVCTTTMLVVPETSIPIFRLMEIPKSQVKSQQVLGV